MLDGFDPSSCGTQPVRQQSVPYNPGRAPGGLMTDGFLHSFTLVVRHGACLYFTRDRLPARYGKVVAALVVQGTWIRDFSFFHEWHQEGIATNGLRLLEAFPGHTLPRQLPNATEHYEETMQKQTVCLNIIICRYLFRLKTLQLITVNMT